jgi:hypothetical protein
MDVKRNILLCFMAMHYKCVKKVARKIFGRKEKQTSKKSRVLHKEARNIARVRLVAYVLTME